MAELIIASAEHSGFKKYDIIKAYRNGYYRRWKKSGIKANTFVLRLPLMRTRKVKRLIHSYAGGKREYYISDKANKKDKECVTHYLPIWIKKK